MINEKSDLVPSQNANYLGMTIYTGAAKIFPALVRVGTFLSVEERFRALSASPAEIWQVLLGHLASLERLVPHSRLRMCSLQWHLKTHWSPKNVPPTLLVPLSREVREDRLDGWCGTIFYRRFNSGHLLRIFTCTPVLNDPMGPSAWP